MQALGEAALLRGGELLGIDSALRPVATRLRVWERIVRDLPMDRIEAMVTEGGLAELPDLARAILAGGVRGGVVVNVRR